MSRADALVGCIEVAPEEAKLVDAIEAYHAQRWPLAK